MTRTWVAQPVGALGAMMADGIRNQLGRPAMSLLTVLVRESVQNSWDARSQKGAVCYSLDAKTLTGDHAQRWRETLSPHAPHPDSLTVASYLKNELEILFVSDRGTKGLGGPVRGDAVVEGLSKDYVSFVLNSGEAQHRTSSGGTYGFGKGIFYQVSRAKTILVHSRCRTEDDQIESRFIGCAIGSNIDLDGARLTGRYWWGIPDDGGVLPLLDDEADELAERLGFPPFEGEELGTTIAVVAPDYGEQPVRAAVDHLADAIRWSCWPKMIAGPSQPPAINFNLQCNGEPVALGDPASDPLLGAFVASYRKLGSVDTKGRVAHGDLGSIGRFSFGLDFGTYPIPEAARELGVGDRVHHTCLLRGPELVVTYLEGPPPPSENIRCSAVFKIDDEVDDVFAKSEPPTHDDWVADTLQGDEHRLVRHALVRVKQLAKAAVTVQSAKAAAPTVQLGAISAQLGGLIAPVAGGGSPTIRQPSPNTDPPPSTSPRVQFRGPHRWELIDDEHLLVVDVVAEATTAELFEAFAGVRTWGSKESQGVNAPKPEIVGWRSPDGKITPRTWIQVGPNKPTEWALLIRPVPETVTLYSVKRMGDLGE